MAAEHYALRHKSRSLAPSGFVDSSLSVPAELVRRAEHVVVERSVTDYPNGTRRYGERIYLFGIRQAPTVDPVVATPTDVSRTLSDSDPTVSSFKRMDTVAAKCRLRGPGVAASDHRGEHATCWNGSATYTV